MWYHLSDKLVRGSHPEYSYAPNRMRGELISRVERNRKYGIFTRNLYYILVRATTVGGLSLIL